MRADGDPLDALPGSVSDETPDSGRWGALVLLERVGSGATGEVWRAWDPQLQRDVALKLLHVSGEAGSDDGGRLLAEARALSKLRHPGVVVVHGIAEHDGRAGLWMECLEGRTLADEIERRGALPAAEVARIGEALARALEAVHAAGIVHRDLKPANVMLQRDGRVVLTDFGLGQRRAVTNPEVERASGTPMFMSPSLLAGGPATPRSDLYALGVTLRFALTGHAPFRARTLSELEREARSGPELALRVERPDAPPALVDTVDRAMAPDSARGFSSADALARALGDAAVPRARSLWRGPALAAALLGVLAVAFLGPSLIARFSRRAPSPPAAAAAIRPYDVEATLVRRTAGGYQRLAAGDRLVPGDRLSLEFHATRPAWVYVLNQDERGESYLLYPQPLFDLGNPLAAETTWVLPGPIGGRENAWTVTSRGGREHFLVVASPTPVAEIEAELSRLPKASAGHPVRYAAIPPATLERLRGVGGVTPLPEEPAARGAAAFERFAGLAGRETGVRGIWVRHVTLENPLR